MKWEEEKKNEYKIEMKEKRKELETQCWARRNISKVGKKEEKRDLITNFLKKEECELLFLKFFVSSVYLLSRTMITTQWSFYFAFALLCPVLISAGTFVLISISGWI